MNSKLSFSKQRRETAMQVEQKEALKTELLPEEPIFGLRQARNSGFGSCDDLEGVAAESHAHTHGGRGRERGQSMDSFHSMNSHEVVIPEGKCYPLFSCDPVDKAVFPNHRK